MHVIMRRNRLDSPNPVAILEGSGVIVVKPVLVCLANVKQDVQPAFKPHHKRIEHDDQFQTGRSTARGILCIGTTSTLTPN